MHVQYQWAKSHSAPAPVDPAKTFNNQGETSPNPGRNMREIFIK